MATQSDFNQDEWNALVELPLLIGTAVIITPQAGPLQFVQEISSLMQFVAASKASPVPLVAAVAQSLEARQAAQNDTSSVDGSTPGAGREDLQRQLLDHIADVNKLLASRVSVEEATDYKLWLIQLAERVAQAAKEGTFLGLGGTRVTEAETMVIAEVAEALGVPRV
jgi:hypothetical protein